jgi:hypothetical protein
MAGCGWVRGLHVVSSRMLHDQSPRLTAMSFTPHSPHHPPVHLPDSHQLSDSKP